MSVQYIEKNGEKAFAVIPIDEYETLMDRLEMAEDIAAYDEVKANLGEWIPADVVNRLLDGESPVKVWREHRGLTQTELAERAGLSQSAIAQLESPKRGGGSMDTYKKLAAALDVSLDELV